MVLSLSTLCSRLVYIFKIYLRPDTQLTCGHIKRILIPNVPSQSNLFQVWRYTLGSRESALPMPGPQFDSQYHIPQTVGYGPEGPQHQRAQKVYHAET